LRQPSTTAAFAGRAPPAPESAQPSRLLSPSSERINTNQGSTNSPVGLMAGTDFPPGLSHTSAGPPVLTADLLTTCDPGTFPASHSLTRGREQHCSPPTDVTAAPQPPVSVLCAYVYPMMCPLISMVAFTFRI
ncbi:MAG: hypothetical protein BJ554DRAFT_7741, partial [Olpidium bornovanus]